ncbi:ChaC-domain-containing protein [Lentithecium fluviatile CBS 122367]|uniref:glutathione-specific gamma-glutamylcyclotransferase n=1 Tax=Lentithecium fluviatile CBS 122367 TaxID=1168545 RepID=A0A6G1IXB8_9PLEO|nr:ChaC-domain-containing protein [Lentithecium fluviatile CBS 122367]
MADPDHERLIEDFGQNDDFWLFGYGSLIWKPPPHYDQRVPGYIEGYVRRFWQASEDHRGTPEAPGRVVTLIDRAHWETLTDHHEPTERVWGAAYHIPSSKVAEVRTYLDIREINGYSIQFTPFHPAAFYTSITSPPSSPPIQPSHASSRSITASTTILAKIEQHQPPIRCLVYIGLPENPQFLGPQDPDALARHILKSRGPSGENREYLFFLEKALLELSRESGDKHVSDLVRRCKEIEREEAKDEEGEEVQEGGDDGDGVEADEAAGALLRKVGSTEEHEEVEK